MAISSAPTLSSPGVGSGLDVNGLVAKLMAVEQRPLTALESKQTAYQSTISAYGAIKSALSSFQSALKSLKDPSTFRTMSATASDASVFTASAAASAVAGSYSVSVTQLALAQKLSSAGFANTTDVIGGGTLTFEFGTTAGSTFTPNGTTGAKTVTIGAGQTTLAGIRDAVNAANIGVTATVVNDGSANGNHLVFTSNNSGAANSLKITAIDGDGTNTDTAGLSQIAYDPAALVGSGRNMTERAVAQNALLTIDGIAVSKASNTVTDAIEGVTLNLLKMNPPPASTTLTVSQDTSGTTKSVQAFVAAYNNLHTMLVSLTKFDPATRKGAVLTGDSTVRLIENQLHNVIGNSIDGLGDSLNILSQVGVAFQKDGSLSLDNSKLSAAISANFSGIASLFAAIGKATDSLIGVSLTGDKTLSGTYAVAVTQIGTQGKLIGGSAAGLVITAGVDDQLTITVDGNAASITLAAGTYASADALAAEVQAKVNGASVFTTAGSSVVVSQTGGALTVASNRYGAASNVSVSGSAATPLFGASPTANSGVDVAGTINGANAVGAGQILSGAAGTAVEGLHLTVSGGALGSRGDVTYTQGYAYQLDNLLKPMLNAGGILAARTDGLTGNIKAIDKQKIQVQARLDALQARYLAQFGALDTMLASMQATSAFLTQQLANLPTPGKNTN